MEAQRISGWMLTGRRYQIVVLSQYRQATIGALGLAGQAAGLEPGHDVRLPLA